MQIMRAGIKQLHVVKKLMLGQQQSQQLVVDMLVLTPAENIWRVARKKGLMRLTLCACPFAALLQAARSGIGAARADVLAEQPGTAHMMHGTFQLGKRQPAPQTAV